MPSIALVKPAAATDAGGVAGRRGFKYQDHAAASFVIEMLENATLLQVECETADDISLRWAIPGGEAIEYVQVKTTEGDSKWSISELTNRTPKNAVGTSLAEKSLNCDRHPGIPLFRFVTTRDVRGELRLFKVPREKRVPVLENFDSLVSRFANRHKQARSPNGRTLQDWARALYWSVESDEATLGRNNQFRILQLAQRHGERPHYEQAQAVYDRLLGLVSAAADASQITHPDSKAITREQAWHWWESELADIRRLNRSHIKVYNISTDRFFSDLHHVDEPTIRRELKAYDVEFDGGVWRCKELAEYLVSWLPEVALPAKVLAEFSHLEARSLTDRAVEALENQSRLDYNRLVAELLLHCILRHYDQSEPIACKLFYVARAGLTSTSANILHHHAGDQLWLGHSRLVAATAHDDVIATVFQELENALDRDILKAERQLILQLREPQHLRSTTLERALERYAKIDELLRVLHIPVLIAYDSKVVSSGYYESYVSDLRDEVIDSYAALKSRLPASLRETQVHIFLVPVESADKLVTVFGECLRGPNG